MARNETTVNINKAARKITVKVTLAGMKKFRFRFFLFKILLKLAVWVSPFGGVEITETENGGE